MNATTIGKSLIVINVILSAVFASWALGIFTNRINWGGNPSVPGDQALSEVGKRKQELTDSEKAAGLGIMNWQSGSADLTKVETVERPQARNWFAAKLKSLEDGAGPVTSLAYAADGALRIGAQGNPIQGPDGQPLQSRNAFRQAIAAVDADIKQTNEQARQDLVAAEKLSIEINGNVQGNLVEQKGLRHLLNEEETARRNARAEIEYVRPFRFNRQSEGGILQKRQASLVQRLDELRKVSTALLNP